MAFLQVVYIVVFVLHNSIYCSRIPLILTARDSLTTEPTKLLEIVTPVFNNDVIPGEEVISTQMPLFPFELNSNPTDRTHFPTEMPTLLNEMTTLSSNTKNKTTETFINKFGQRLPKLFGRLAFLAGLRLADEMSNGTSSINFSSAKDSSNPLPANLSPTKLSPYFAAVYEPFPFYPQTYIYSNLLGLIPLLNSQKTATDNNFSGTEKFPNSQQSFMSSTENGDRTSQDFSFIPENRKNENVTIEERIIEKVTLNKKQRNPIRDKVGENTKLETSEKEDDEYEETEDIEENEENTEEGEENYDPEESNVDAFVPTTKAPPLKVNKVLSSVKFLKQRRTTTRRPVVKKTTMTPIIDTTTDINVNSTTTDNTTQVPVLNNTGYPPHPGYYGGYSQNIHDLYITSSENPPLHKTYNYNEINPDYSEEWPSNRIPHESHFYNHNQPLYDILPYGEEEYNPHSFRGSPDSLSSGFKPSFPF